MWAVVEVFTQNYLNGRCCKTALFSANTFAQSVLLVLLVGDIIYFQLFKPYSDNIIMLLILHWTLLWRSSFPLPQPRLHRSILDPSAWPRPAMTSPFLPQITLTPVTSFPLTPYHSHYFTSSYSSSWQRYLYYPSQARNHSLEVWDGKTETWVSGDIPSHSYFFPSNITCL